MGGAVAAPDRARSVEHAAARHRLAAWSGDFYNQSMSAPILATKLYIPPPRTDVVLRSRLIERLDEDLCRGPGFRRKLTLISAPAGFGKTTLISEWIPEMAVRSNLIVTGDAAATADKIMTSESLFRLGFVGDLAMIMADVAIALLFYALLRPVSHVLALMAAFFRLAQAAALGINLLNMFFALQLLGGADYLGTLSADQSNALALMFLDAHAAGYRLALVFFGFSILILGYLLVKSDYFPRILGYGMFVASVIYVADSVAYFMLSNYVDYEAVFDALLSGPVVLAELSLCAWLLWKGVRVPQQDTRALASTTQAERIGA